MRNPKESQKNQIIDLSRYRKKINKIDNKLISLLEKRFKVMIEIRKVKKSNKLPLRDKKREKVIKTQFKDSKLPSGFSNRFFELLFTGK